MTAPRSRPRWWSSRPEPSRRADWSRPPPGRSARGARNAAVHRRRREQLRHQRAPRGRAGQCAFNRVRGRAGARRRRALHPLSRAKERAGRRPSLGPHRRSAGLARPAASMPAAFVVVLAIGLAAVADAIVFLKDGASPPQARRGRCSPPRPSRTCSALPPAWSRTRPTARPSASPGLEVGSNDRARAPIASPARRLRRLLRRRHSRIDLNY